MILTSVNISVSFSCTTVTLSMLKKVTSIIANTSFVPSTKVQVEYCEGSQ